MLRRMLVRVGYVLVSSLRRCLFFLDLQLNPREVALNRELSRSIGLCRSLPLALLTPSAQQVRARKDEGRQGEEEERGGRVTCTLPCYAHPALSLLRCHCAPDSSAPSLSLPAMR